MTELEIVFGWNANFTSREITFKFPDGASLIVTEGDTLWHHIAGIYPDDLGKCESVRKCFQERR